jgi:murein DD-endopeptidase MepM/ murein hydrolase activator NlpD
MSTCYGHQSQINVSVGQHVSQGEVIGLVGCTGLCFGAHLHFEVRSQRRGRQPAELPLALLAPVVQPEIHIGGVSLKTFGLMFALAFLAVGALIARRFKELGKPVDWAYEISFAALLGGLWVRGCTSSCRTTTT